MTITKDTTYSSALFTANGYNYIAVKAEGKFNYIHIKQTGNNRSFGGNEFKTYDDAVKHYKSAEMKKEILKLETGITKFN